MVVKIRMQVPFGNALLTTDAEEQMPPPESHKMLKPEQREVLRQWIQQGLRGSPTGPFIPRCARRCRRFREPGQWNRIPLMRSSWLSWRPGPDPNPEADRRTLARRLSLDLTGLPPDPAEVEAFVADRSPTTTKSYVRRLMDSPLWGNIGPGTGWMRPGTRYPRPAFRQLPGDVAVSRLGNSGVQP